MFIFSIRQNNEGEKYTTQWLELDKISSYETTDDVWRQFLDFCDANSHLPHSMKENERYIDQYTDS